jgi:hypothetical protein
MCEIVTHSVDKPTRASRGEIHCLEIGLDDVECKAEQLEHTVSSEYCPGKVEAIFAGGSNIVAVSASAVDKEHSVGALATQKDL